VPHRLASSQQPLSWLGRGSSDCMPAKMRTCENFWGAVPAFHGRLRGGTWWKGGCWKSVARLGFYDDRVMDSSKDMSTSWLVIGGGFQLKFLITTPTTGRTVSPSREPIGQHSCLLSYQLFTISSLLSKSRRPSRILPKTTQQTPMKTGDIRCR
jgi:hypothetical protein